MVRQIFLHESLPLKQADGANYSWSHHKPPEDWLTPLRGRCFVTRTKVTTCHEVLGQSWNPEYWIMGQYMNFVNHSCLEFPWLFVIYALKSFSALYGERSWLVILGKWSELVVEYALKSKLPYNALQWLCNVYTIFSPPNLFFYFPIPSFLSRPYIFHITLILKNICDSYYLHKETPISSL